MRGRRKFSLGRQKEYELPEILAGTKQKSDQKKVQEDLSGHACFALVFANLRDQGTGRTLPNHANPKMSDEISLGRYERPDHYPNPSHSQYAVTQKDSCYLRRCTTLAGTSC
jgi:hypothetical protein